MDHIDLSDLRVEISEGAATIARAILEAGNKLAQAVELQTAATIVERPRAGTLAGVAPPAPLGLFEIARRIRDADFEPPDVAGLPVVEQVARFVEWLDDPERREVEKIRARNAHRARAGGVVIHEAERPD